MELYATKYNLVYHLDKIINRHLNPSIPEYLVEDLIFSRTNNKYLSDYVIGQCYYLVEFLDNPETFLKRHGKVWTDTKKYYTESRPCYHTSYDCERMNAGFINVSIPSRLRSNSDIVRLVRSAPKAILYHDTRNGVLSKLCNEINEKYRLTPPVKIEEFKPIEKETGENDQLENDINEIVKKVEDLHKRTEKYLKNNRHLYAYKDAHFKPPSYAEFKRDYSCNYKSAEYLYTRLCNDLYYFRKNFLNPIRRKLRYYVLGKCNNEVKFDDGVLDLLGFRPCISCKNSSK